MVLDIVERDNMVIVLQDFSRYCCAALHSGAEYSWFVSGVCHDVGLGVCLDEA